ncbi:MAG: alpha-ketoacid dehydrogenase subunit beta [Nitrospirae bacterium]|nr:alpha-ketoacid dehydrogenase subunit beta [Nitrospirota bacterium]
MTREITYSEAILEATTQLMEGHPEVYLIGEGVDDFNGLWGSTKGLYEKFGDQRVLDIPISENALTGIAAGSALVGFRPIFTHQRIDFMLMCMDALFNNIAKWQAMTGYKQNMPFTARGIVGRGWGQSVQHAQSFYPVFAHFPGVKVVAPYSPYEAKGLLTAAVLAEEPVIVIEARSLYSKKGCVPEDFYTLDFGKGEILRDGSDVTIAGLSYILEDLLSASDLLKDKGISAEVINLRSIKPFDMDILIESVSKTGNLVIADITWDCFNLASELSCRVNEQLFTEIKRPPLRLTLPEMYVGASRESEENYYMSAESIAKKIFCWLDQPMQKRQALQ